MIAFAFIDEDGFPTRSGVLRSLPDGAVALPNLEAEARRLMWKGGAWLERPVLPAAQPTADGFQISGVSSEGVTVRVIDVGGLTDESFPVTEGTYRQTLPPDGEWEVIVAGPKPFVESTVLVRRGSGSVARNAAGLAYARKAAVVRINTIAGQVRSSIFTDIPGQEAIYLEKRAEARAYIAQATQAGAPSDLAEYPLLAGEIGVTAPDAWQLAQLWLNSAELFRRVGAATETHRLRALAALATAPDHETIETIQTTFTEALSRLSI